MHSIVRVRETRITQIISHILIGLSIFLVPYPLAYIPTAVLDGLFLYMAITSLSGNQMFERITLLFMEQVSSRRGLKAWLRNLSYTWLPQVTSKMINEHLFLFLCVLIDSPHDSMTCYLTTPGGISSESLHPKMPSKKDPLVHVVSIDSTGNHVFLWLQSMVLCQNGLSGHYSPFTACQV